MKKQDRQGARTVAELNRRYNVKKAMGVANDSLAAASNAQATAAKADMTASEADKKASEAKEGVDDKIGRDESDYVVEMINKSNKVLTLLLNRLIIESENFKMDSDGSVEAKSIKLRNEFYDGRFVDVSDGILTVAGAIQAGEGDSRDFPLMNFKVGQEYYSLCVRCNPHENADGSATLIPSEIVFRQSNYANYAAL